MLLRVWFVDRTGCQVLIVESIDTTTAVFSAIALIAGAKERHAPTQLPADPGGR
jgi:hypothetical protein